LRQQQVAQAQIDRGFGRIAIKESGTTTINPNPMNRPSEKALRLGEELFEYVPYGLTRSNAIQELAEMADEANQDLREAVRAVLQDAQRNGGVPTAFHVAHLQRVFSDYEPLGWSSVAQGELAGIGRPARAAGQPASTWF
jgi:hypothetical protein